MAAIDPGAPARPAVAPRPRRASPAEGDLPVPQPRAVVARVQRPRPPRGARRAQPAPRAGQVPGHLRRQPRRVLPGPGRRPPPAGRGRQGRPLAGRPDRRRAAGRGSRRASSSSSPITRPSSLTVRRALAAEGVELARLRGHPRAPRRAPPALPRRDLPGPDAAGGRPGPSVPVHLDAEPVDRGRAARSGDRRARLRPGQGAADPAAPARGRADRASSCSTRSSRPTSTRCSRGMEVEEHHLFRVTRNADFEIEEDEADDLLLAIEEELRRRRFGAAVRLEVERSMPPATRDPAPARPRARRGRLLRGQRDARPDRAVPARRPRPARPQARRPGRRSRRPASSRPTRTSRPTSSPRSAPATSSSTTRTNRSPRRSSGSSPRRPTIPRS